MKKNTQKLLLALFSIQENVDTFLPISVIKSLLPQFTEGGIRSLLHTLKKNNWIIQTKISGRSLISLTNYGKEALIRRFPALLEHWDTWTGEFDCLVFTTAPATDKQFRYLRNLLIDEKAVAINRGVYIAPHSFSERVLAECKQTYFNSVILFSISEWKIAVERLVIFEKYALTDVIENLSGVSSDVTRMTSFFETHKRLTDSQKKEISLVYDRLVEILSDDPGFCHYYFPALPRTKTILVQLGKLLVLA